MRNSNARLLVVYVYNLERYRLKLGCKYVRVCCLLTVRVKLATQDFGSRESAHFHAQLHCSRTVHNFMNSGGSK
jgi:hypothetical protein